MPPHWARFPCHADPSLREFNELVNMTPSELKDWLGTEESTGSGWGKDDGYGMLNRLLPCMAAG